MLKVFFVMAVLLIGVIVVCSTFIRLNNRNKSREAEMKKLFADILEKLESIDKKLNK